MQAPYSMSRSNGTTTPLEESKEWTLEADSWYVQPSHTFMMAGDNFELNDMRLSQVHLALGIDALQQEKAKSQKKRDVIN